MVVDADSRGNARISCTIVHPRYGGPGRTGPEVLARRASSKLDIETSIFTVDQTGRPAVHIAYGDPGPPPAWRFAALALLALVPLLGIAMMRRKALRQPDSDRPAAYLMHMRFITAVTTGLTAYWWIVFSLLDIPVVLSYQLAFKPLESRLLSHAALAVGVPALIFAGCEFVWAPVRRRFPMRAGRPGDPSRSPYHLFAGGFLPLHLSLAGFFSFFQDEPLLGIGCNFASVFCSALYLKFAAKPGELSKFVLLAPELRARILELASNARVKLREIFVLPDTGNHFANAFASSKNDIWLSEGLLRKLGRREVDAIVTHELGHLKRSHPVLKVIAWLAPMLLGTMIELFMSESGPRSRPWPRNVAFPFCLILAYATFYFFSRRFEYSADRFASKSRDDAEAMISGLARLTGETLPLNWSKWDEKFLTHPSTLRRVSRIASNNGIGEERLSQLLETKLEPDDRYSLAAGASAGPQAELQDHTVIHAAKAHAKRRERTKYALMPPIAAFLLVALGLVVFLLIGTHSPDQYKLFEYPVGISICAGIVAVGLGASAGIARALKKRLAFGAIPDWNFKPAPADLRSGIDTATFKRLSAELGSLGFTDAVDYVGGHRATPLLCFYRVLTNPHNRCYATLSQVTTETLGVTPVVGSFVALMQDGTRLFTTNTEPTGADYAVRLPTEVEVHRADSSPSELFRVHLERMQRLAEEGGTEPVVLADHEAFLSRRHDFVNQKLRKAKRRFSLLFLLEVDLFNRKPKLEWGGIRSRKSPPGSAPQAQIDSAGV